MKIPIEKVNFDYERLARTMRSYLISTANPDWVFIVNERLLLLSHYGRFLANLRAGIKRVTIEKVEE